MAELWWSSLDDCTKQEWGGHNVWCNPPFHMVEPVLLRFLDCKRRSPTNTSVTVVVPAWVGASWWEILEQNFLFVRYFPPWSTLFTASPVKGTDARRLMGPVRWPVIVAVCKAGPLVFCPNRNHVHAELSPERLKQVIKDLEEKTVGGEPDPLSLIKFGPDLTSEQKERIVSVLRPFGRRLWALSNLDLAVPINVIEHHIHCTDTAPIVRKGAPKSHVENQAIGAWAAEMLASGIIGRSTSLNSAPIVIVLKRQEPGDTSPQEIRVCINYRARNEKTHGDDTSCPEVMPTLQALRGSQWFGSADGKSAFHQIAMAPDSRAYTAFNIRGKGSFEFLRMPFGLKTAPATFIRAMDMILEGAKRLHPFIDDIKHGAPDFEGHLADIEDLASRCVLHNLHLSPKKFMAGYRSLCALGYVVDVSGLHPDPAKVEAITLIIQPQDTTGLRSFLGMVGFYSALIPNYSTLSAPLHALTARNMSVVKDWGEVQTHAFESLKSALAAAPGLAYPDVDKRFKLTTDWQPGHMAAILSQMWQPESGEEVDRPLHFLAKKLSGYEASWPATTGEQACAVWAIRKLHAYLFGVQFDLIMDHKALVSMLQCQETTGELARWNVDLYPYDFVVHHRPGKDLTNADGLSRTDKEIRAEVLDPGRISVPEVCTIQSMEEDHPTPSNSTPQGGQVHESSAPPAASNSIVHEQSHSTCEEASYDITEYWSLEKQLPPADVHPVLWDAYMKEMRISSRGKKYYPSTFFQRELARDVLVAVYPFLEMASAEIPDDWGARVPGKFGQAVLHDLYDQFNADCNRYAARARPLNCKGDSLYCGQSALFWHEVMAELRYWQPIGPQPWAPLLLSWEMEDLIDDRDLYLASVFTLDPMGFGRLVDEAGSSPVRRYPSPSDADSDQPIPGTASEAPGSDMSDGNSDLPSPMSTWNSELDTPFEERLMPDELELDDWDTEEALIQFERDFAEQLHLDLMPKDEFQDLSDSDEVPLEIDEYAQERKWLQDNMTCSEAEKATILNGKEPPEIPFQCVDQEVPRILYMTEALEDALSASRDVWQNPIFMSYIKYEVMPFNITYGEAHKIRVRAKHYRWISGPKRRGENLLYFHKGKPNRVYPSPNRRPALLFAAHEEAHQKKHGMVARLGRTFFWYSMRDDIKIFIRQCQVCSTVKTLQTADREMVAIPPHEKGKRWHLDLVGPLAEGTAGERFIAVAVDSCTKWPEAAPLKSKSPAEVEAFFYRNVICRHPVEEVVTDNGTEFMADFADLCKDLGLTHIKTAVYHPQANGVVERFNGTLKTALSSLVKDHPNSWPYLIPRVLRAFRSTPHSTTGVPPGYYLMGVEMGPVSLEAIAWQKYTDPSQPSKFPQGIGWYRKKILKPFCNPITKRLQLYAGEVTQLIVTPEGQERYHTVYEDKDWDDLEVGNLLPWYVYANGFTHLEDTSGVDPQGLPRIEHILLTMLTFPAGHLVEMAKRLTEQDPSYARLLTVTPTFRSPASALDTARHLGYSSQISTPPAGSRAHLLVAKEKQRLESIAAQGKKVTARAQAKQERGYANRRKPRNRRVEKLKVGANCKISKRTRASRSLLQAKTWEVETYEIVEIKAGSIKVRMRSDPDNTIITCLKEDVLPIFTAGLDDQDEEAAATALAAQITEASSLADDNLEGPSNGSS